MRCKARVCCLDTWRPSCSLCPHSFRCPRHATHLLRGTFGDQFFCDLHYPMWVEHRAVLARILSFKPR